MIVAQCMGECVIESSIGGIGVGTVGLLVRSEHSTHHLRQPCPRVTVVVNTTAGTTSAPLQNLQRTTAIRNKVTTKAQLGFALKYADCTKQSF